MGDRWGGLVSLDSAVLVHRLEGVVDTAPVVLV